VTLEPPDPHRFPWGKLLALALGAVAVMAAMAFVAGLVVEQLR
jgi:hypothetical protein